MPKVIGTVTSDGNITTTQFTGTATNNSQTYYFDDTQDSMVFSTDGYSELTLKVDGRSYVVKQNTPVQIYEDFSSFNVTRKDKGSQSFQLTSYVFADETDAVVLTKVENVLTSTNTKNALSANQGRLLADNALGINNNTITPTYTNGQLMKVEETEGAAIKTSANLTYNTDGTVNTITEFVVGETIVTTLNYTNGDFTSATKVVL